MHILVVHAMVILLTLGPPRGECGPGGDVDTALYSGQTQAPSGIQKPQCGWACGAKCGLTTLCGSGPWTGLLLGTCCSTAGWGVWGQVRGTASSAYLLGKSGSGPSRPW